MFNFLVYLAESALCLAALYLVYKVAMSNDTLHRLNRVLLLGSVVLSAVLPLCHVKIVKEYDPAPTLSTIAIDDMVVADVAELGIDYISLLKDLAVVIFILGVAFMLVRLAVGIYSVWRLIHSGEMSVIEEDVTLTVVSQLSSPFSWFGHIVASQSDVQEFRRMILSHELAHIRLHHSWDVMAVDLALCLWWFNPAMWLLRRELQSLHEYQADEAVLDEGVDAKTYQMLLIKRAVGSRLHSVANCLNHSNLKNRITMMCKKNSSRWSAAKLLLVLPLVAVSLAATATTVYVAKQQDKGNENFVNEQVVDLDGQGNPQEPQKQLTKNAKFEKGDTIEMKSATGESMWVRYFGDGSSVLVLIDGKEGRMEDLKVEDIDSFTVIKNDEALKAYGEKGKNGVILITTKKAAQANKQQSAQEEAFIKVESMPTFQGGDLDGYRNWFQSQLQYPAEAKEKGIKGRVIFSFVVEKDGSVSEFKVLNTPDKLLSAEIERVFKLTPKWEPGKQNGKAVRVKYTVPIVFML